MEFRILGSLELVGAQGPIAFGGAKRRGLLAFLLVHRGRVVSGDRLLDALYGEDDVANGGTRTIQTYISQLRKVLLDAPGVQLTSGANRYVLDVPDDALDAARFESALAASATEVVIDRRLALLDTALSCWRGTPLEEFSWQWAVVERVRLEQRHLEALCQRIEMRMERGEHLQVLPELEVLTGEHPLDERLWGQRMLASYRAGRQADALRAFQQLRRHLGEELGVDPSPELVELERRVLAHDPALRASEHRIDDAVEPRSELPSGVVTFLLTDIVGSTELWDSRPDSTALAVERHEAIICQVVNAHAGTTLKARGEGDSTISVFVRATDAAAAALALQEAFDHETWPGGLTVPTRIAIHTGEAQLRDGDYYGATLNRATRLRGLAEAGAIVCSRATAELVADTLPRAAMLTEVGARQLRGLSRSETPFVLWRRAPGRETAPTLVKDDTTGDAGLGDRFIGRNAEFATLRRALHDTARGHVRIALVTGELGIGKTRLAEALAEEARSRGHRVVWGRCHEGESAPALWPWVQILRAHAESAAESSPERLPNLVLAEDYSSMIEQEGTRFRLFDSVTVFLRHSAATQPLVLILDDIHAADEPSLLLLEFAARHLDDVPMFVVVTARSNDMDMTHAMWSTAAELLRLPKALHISLAGFDDHETAAFITALTPDMPTAELATVLRERTSGNPFFLGETVRLLATEGGLDSRGAMEARLPEGIRAVIRRRVSRLPLETQRLLASASVIGREFSLPLLECVVDEPDTVPSLDRAVAARIVAAHESPGVYRFVHVLVRDVLYDGISPTDRRELHRRVAAALVERHRLDVEDHLDAIAHHLAKAAVPGTAAAAADFGMRAGDRAMRLFSYHQAAAHFERVLKLVEIDPVLDEERRCRACNRLAEAVAQADPIRAQGIFLETTRLATRLKMSEEFVRAVLGLSATHWFSRGPGGPREPRLALVDRALDLVGEAEPVLRARVLACLADELYHSAPLERRSALAAEAVATARATGDLQTIAATLSAKHVATWVPENVVERANIAAELSEVAGTLGDVQLEQWASALRFADLLELGDAAGTRQVLGNALARAAAFDEPSLRRHAALSSAVMSSLTGAFVDAERAAGEALDMGQRIGNQFASTSAAACIGIVRLLQGRLDELVEPLELFDREQGWQPVWRCALAAVHAERGDQARAIGLLAQLLPDDAALAAWHRTDWWMFEMASLACAASDVGDRTRTRMLCEALAPFRGRMIVLGRGIASLGPVDHFIGLLTAALGLAKERDEYFAAALDLDDRFEARPFSAMTQLAWATSLLRSGEPEQARHAAVVADRARATARELGMAVIKQRAEAVLAVNT